MSNAKHKQSPAQVLRRLMATLLAAMMLLTFVPAVSLPAFAAGETKAADNNFMRAFLLDCGRIYFSVDDIKGIIDNLSENNYTHLTLAFGNSGFRFLLNDMDVGSYSSDDVQAAIKTGNDYYVQHDGHENSNAANDCLTESDMNVILAYADSKNIAIIPALNSPGHMNAVVQAMQTLGVATKAGYNGAASTIDITNSKVTAFVDELIDKYIAYFGGKGCSYFHVGADEFCNDPTDKGTSAHINGINDLSADMKTKFVSYVNDVATKVSNAGMTPIMFNDGFYGEGANFNKNIVVSYWNGNGSVGSKWLSDNGYKILNTNMAWYYVLGEPWGTGDVWCSYQRATNGVNNTPVTVMQDGGAVSSDNLVGSMMAFWCDYTNETYTEGEQNKVAILISTLAEKNPTYFVKSTTDGGDSGSDGDLGSDPDSANTVNVNLVVGETSKNYTVGGEHTVSDTSVASVAATAVPGESKTVYTLVKSLQAGTTYYVSTNAADANPTAQLTLESASGGYYLKNSSGVYIYPNASYSWGNWSWSWSLSTSSSRPSTVCDITTDSETGATTTTTTTNWFGTTETAYLTLSGSTFGAQQNEAKLYFYTAEQVETVAATALAFTGTKPGTDSVTVGDKTFKITVSPKEVQKNISLTYNSDTNLNAVSDLGFSGTGYTVNYSLTSGDCVTINNNTVTAKDSTGEATVTATVSKDGVTFGTVAYTVTVSAEDITNITLIYHPWISTYSVYPEGTGQGDCTNQTGTARNVEIKATSPGVHSKSGAEFSTLVDPTGDWRWEEDAQTVFWKGTVLAEGYHQENEDAADRSMSGTDFTYIRYWNGEWAYSSDRETWTAIKSTDEVCAYYLQKTDVTTEVTTYVKDWAFTADNANKGSSRYQKALSFAVVYEDGTLNPAEADIYGNSTLIYWDNLANLGFIRVGIGNGYEVTKITYTLGARANTSTHNWQSNETINWQKKNVDETTTWYDETVCWDETYQTEPIVNGATLSDKIYAGTAQTTGGEATNYNGTWGANDAVLILIYIKPIVTEDTLHVIYKDEIFNDTLYSMDISVNSGITFSSGITPNPGAFGSAGRIDVTGCTIQNSLGVNRNLETDLTKLPAFMGRYNKDLYKYTGAEISADGKTLYIYYTINTEVLSPNLVVDFGLPVKFYLNQIVNDTHLVKTVTPANGKYGTLIYQSSDQSFTYTPNKILANVDVLSITVEFTTGKSQLTNVGITPASTVYYEESFINTDSNWTSDGQSEERTQNTAVLGSDSNNYGYDEAYNSNTGYSGGSAYKVTVGNTNQSATASFTFTGTGFDIMSVTGANTGAFSVSVTGANNFSKNIFVDTYYGYSQVDAAKPCVKYTWQQGTDGKWHVVKREELATISENVKFGQRIQDNGAWISYELNLGVNAAAATDLYQIPVISCTGLAHGEYTVTIKAVYYGVFDHQKDGSYNVFIDGVRIYNTLQDSSVYQPDGENDPQFTEIRDILIESGTLASVGETSGVAFVDGYNETDNINVYEAYGPNNEVYLKPGQAIAFMAGDGTYFIGAKSPDGGATMVINNGDPTQIDTATDMYYAVTPTAEGYIVVANDANSTGILSLTTIKAVGSAATPAVYSVDANVVAYARAMVLDMIQPAPAFEPATLEAEWTTFKFFSYSTHTLTVRTSEDVEYITVGDREIRDFYYTVKLEGSGWNRKLVKYKVFTLVLGNDAELGDYTITAYNADGNASAPKTAALSGETWFDKFN